MRVVLDSNVLARAASGPPGPADALLSLLTESPHVLLLSEFLAAELSRVLRYGRVRVLHGMDDKAVDRYIAGLQAAAVVVAAPTTGGFHVVEADPDDDPVVATAVAGRADVLCTRDRHLYRSDVVEYCRAHGIEVIDDLELLRRIRSAGAADPP